MGYDKTVATIRCKRRDLRKIESLYAPSFIPPAETVGSATFYYESAQATRKRNPKIQMYDFTHLQHGKKSELSTYDRAQYEPVDASGKPVQDDTEPTDTGHSEDQCAPLTTS